MNPLLEAENLCFEYPQAQRDSHRAPALRGLNLRIPKAVKLAIIGENGAGKSTLLWHMNGTLKPQAGQLRYDGSRLDYSRRGLNALRRKIALVLQEPDDQLFAGTIRQDVSFGPLNLGLSDAEAASRVDEALGLMGLTELAHLPPHQLSHGQRKRAAIAGALAMQPELMVLDEPTAGLDPRSVEALSRQLTNLHAVGITIVLTTHDIDFAHEWADQVAVMQDGQIVAHGETDAILGNADLMHRTGMRMPFRLALEAAMQSSVR